MTIGKGKNADRPVDAFRRSEYVTEQKINEPR